MDQCMSIALILVLILVLIMMNSREDFNGGPSPIQKKRLIDASLQNPHLFDGNNGSYRKATEILPGIDNVTYEDFRDLWRKGHFTREAMEAALKSESLL